MCLARDNYFPEILTNSLEFILLSLSQKGDLERIKKLFKDKDVKKFLPSLRVREFQVYALLEKNESEKIIQQEIKSKNIRLGSLPKSMLYNLAEAYFREAKYKDSIKYFDKYISKFSEDKLSSKARLRIALGYEILGRDLQIVKKLYKNAINRSSNSEDRYEAAIRFVGVSYLRANKKVHLSDVETFLEAPKELEGNDRTRTKKTSLVNAIKNINCYKKYNLAFDYYNSLPLEIIIIEDRKVFFGDFSEVVLGKMYDSFIKKYAEVVRVYSSLEKGKTTLCQRDRVILNLLLLVLGNREVIH